MNSTLSDELLSINAIYAPDTLVELSEGSDNFILRIPASDVSLRVHIPKAYPDVRPSILGPESVGAVSKRGEASEIVSLVKGVLEDCFHYGEPCFYDLLVGIEARASEVKAMHSEMSTARQSPAEDDSVQHEASPWPSQQKMLELKPPWILSEVVTEKKSVFLARISPVTTLSDAQAYIEHLVMTDKKASKATHNIAAWRIRDTSSDASFQDFDDDGETAAGGRLLHLLQVIDAWNVVVVVSRWYGGVRLGPDRFRLINSTARDALARGGFA